MQEFPKTCHKKEHSDSWRLFNSHELLNTCARFAGTHGGLFERTHRDVLNLHTGGPSLFLSSLLLSLFRRSSFSLSLVLFLCSLLSSLLSSLPSFSATMTMITRSVGSLCTQSSDLPECQCAWASVHSLFGEHVRIMQETTVLV